MFRLVCGIVAVGLLASCTGVQESYHGPCDEPAGLAVGCDVAQDEQILTPADACMKLARCGIVLVRDEQDEQQEDENNDEDPTRFEVCVREVEDSMRGQGDVVLICIEEATCADLSQVDPEQQSDPEREAERFIGYCGRLGP